MYYKLTSSYQSKLKNLLSTAFFSSHFGCPAHVILRAFMFGGFDVLVRVDTRAVDGGHVQIFGFRSGLGLF
jgi:hypothetical protein